VATNAPRMNIVCYDITDPKRLGRVHRYLVKHGLALQYSVFVVVADRDGLLAILAGISGLIDQRTDDVRAYPLPSRLEYTHLGRQLFPEGVTLSDATLNPDLFHHAA